LNDIVVSGKVQKLIDEANASFGRGKELILAAYEVATNEDGMSSEAAKELLLEKCTLFKKSTIYNWLPGESKRLTRPKKIPELESQKSVNIIMVSEAEPQPKDEIRTPDTTGITTNIQIGAAAERIEMEKLAEKYAPELVIHINVPNFFGQLFAANRNNTGAYLYIKNHEVYRVEPDNVHKLEAAV